jgi:hypothetical protein
MLRSNNLVEVFSVKKGEVERFGESEDIIFEFPQGYSMKIGAAAFLYQVIKHKFVLSGQVGTHGLVQLLQLTCE